MDDKENQEEKGSGSAPKVVVSCSADSDLYTSTTKSSTTISCVKVSKPRELVSTENGDEEKKANIMMIKASISEHIITDAIALYRQLKSWNKVKDEINKKYSQSYSIDIIVNRVKDLIGEEEYKKLVSLPKKTKIPSDTIQKIIVRYRQIGDLTQIANEFNYSYWILTENLKDYLGDLEYKNLIDEGLQIAYSKRKIIIPENILEEMISRYKIYGDLRLVAKDYSEYTYDVIYYRIKEYLGDDKYEALIKKFSKRADIAFPRKINIPEDIILQFIVNYKEYGSWYKVSKNFSNYKVALIIDKVKNYLGYNEYKKLVQDYSVRIPETILIPHNTLDEAIEQFKFLRSWGAVAEIYEFNSRTLVRRIIEYIGQNNYKLLLENYPYRTEIPEVILRQMINKYIETPSWAKVAENYEDYSVDIIVNRVKEFLGLKNYLKLKESVKKYTCIDEYDPIFYEEIYRISIAWRQVIKKINTEIVELVSEDIIPTNYDEFYLFLLENTNFKMFDILEGEIIDKESITDLHHIDRNKKNNDKFNVVYLLKKNHGIITAAQQYWSELSDFFEKLLKNNFELLLKGIIPESWKIGWRTLAKNLGLKFPVGKYVIKKRKMIDLTSFF